MLAEPQDTAADLSFSLAGIRVRVSAWFWLAAALIGWNVCQSYARGDQRACARLAHECPPGASSTGRSPTAAVCAAR